MPQVTLTYTFASEQDALDFLAGRSPQKDKAPAPKSAPKADPAASSPSAASTPSPTPAAPAAAPAEPKPIAYADSGLPALIKDAVGRDRQGVVDLLKKYGAPNGSGLKPEQYEAFKAEIVKVGAGDLG